MWEKKPRVNDRKALIVRLYLSLCSPHQSVAWVTGNTVVIFFSELISKTTVCGELRRQLPSAELEESQ